MPLGIDATIRYATNNWTRPAPAVRARAPTAPYNTRTAPRPAADADRQPRPRLDPGRRRARATRATSTTSSSRAPAGAHAFSSDRRAVPARRRALRRRRARPTGASRPPRADRRLGRLRLARRALALARPCTTPRCASLGLDDWRYQQPPAAARALRRDGRARCRRAGFAGVNVTIPHKEAALALADEATDTARAIGAANTLTFDAATGAIARRQHGRARPARGASRRATPPRARTALVLGAGGAARAAVHALLQRRGGRRRGLNRTPRAGRAPGRRARRRTGGRRPERGRPHRQLHLGRACRTTDVQGAAPARRYGGCRKLRGGHGLPGRRHGAPRRGKRGGGRT